MSRASVPGYADAVHPPGMFAAAFRRRACRCTAKREGQKVLRTRRKIIEAASVGAAFGSMLSAGPLATAARAADRPEREAKVVDLDDRVTFALQLGHDVAPAVLMSIFLVAPGDVDDFLTASRGSSRSCAGSPA